ncbi:MAG: UDP-N-acetylmuramoyl-L-alanine--D-glutamate ligase, partial [Agathobacter sp.]|nr:UDP-N-acetylmuramoyl-L-alanine--D-glutamate ligase [Agathobacter sp.]
MINTEKKVLVVGTGISGVAATALLLEKGLDVVLFDGNAQLDVDKFHDKNPTLAQVPLILGEISEDVMDQTGLLVLSPGVPTDLPMVEKFRERQIPIWGEIELAYAYAKGDIVAITGTNGKTTTTALTGQIMEAYFADVKVVGNIGIPYTSMALQTKEDTVTVAEISSFQLETIHKFAPKVTAILNITPDHLNRHHTMEAYIQAKTDITKNQTKEQICVLNYEDEVLREFAETCPATVVFFSSKRVLAQGFYLKDKEIYYAHDDVKELVIHVDDLQILGNHNYENVMS